MKLYKISGSNEYVDWDVLHNQQGYSLEATNSVTWMSAGDSTHEWGESVNTGYLEPIILRFTNSKGFCLGVYGWHTLNEMALEYGLWPDEAEEEEARSSTLGVSKVAVLEYVTSLRPPETAKMYLVQKELEEGWMDEDTFAERGWEIVPDVPLGELVFVDASTGAVVYSVETLNEMVFAPTGYFTIEDADDVVFVEQSPYPIVCQYSETHYGEVQANAGVTLALPYYTQKLYLYEVVAVGGNVTSGWEIVNDNGFVRVVNKTGAAVTAVVFIIRLIDATDASIVDVEYISTGFRASAFKWSGGTDYYFIPFYEEETGWTDDLSAIGWQEVPSVVLPTVSVIDDFGPYNWLYPQGASASVSITMQSNDVKNARLSDSNVPYDSGKSYGVVQWQNTPGVKDGAIELSIVNNSDYIALKNISSASITIRQAKVAVCSDSTATIITVYNANNVAYNAFKYTASGTDYYYVLDGVQADWTDDLSSLGYHLPTYGYPSEAGDTNDNVSVSTSGVHFLYNSQGSVITVPSGSTVSGTAYQRNGSPTLGFNGLYLYPGSTIVCMDLSTSYSFVSIWRVEYTVS